MPEPFAHQPFRSWTRTALLALPMVLWAALLLMNPTMAGKDATTRYTALLVQVFMLFFFMKMLRSTPAMEGHRPAWADIGELEAVPPYSRFLITVLSCLLKRWPMAHSRDSLPPECGVLQVQVIFSTCAKLRTSLYQLTRSAYG